MEQQFKKTTFSCLDPAVREVQNMELTQEIRLPDSLPDIGQILCVWGQPILRGKEWAEGAISFSGGMMLWVLYAPEDGSQERCIDGWIPFQMKWDLPEGVPEGTIRIQCLPRFLDGRSVSARKLLVRCAVAAMAEALVPMEAERYILEDMPEEVQLLHSRYPVRVSVEAGEKTFRLEEDLSMPASMPQPREIISFRMEPRITDKKVLGSRVVFRGNGNLHALYRDESGRIQSWDFELPFSQFSDLDREYGADAQPDLMLLPTGLELELGDEGQLRFRGTMSAQYRITDKQLLDLIEDAYSPGRELQLQRQMLELPVVLETRRENLFPEQSIPGEGVQMADIQLLADFPRQRRSERGVEMVYPCQFQLLYYGQDGTLQSSSTRWEEKQLLPADTRSELTAVPVPSDPPQVIQGSGQITVNGNLSTDLTTTVHQQIPMVTGLELGELRQPDPVRPSLILRRAGGSRLWDIAKENGSTMDAIRRANGLQEEPAPDRMLLIPVL